MIPQSKGRATRQNPCFSVFSFLLAPIRPTEHGDKWQSFHPLPARRRRPQASRSEPKSENKTNKKHKCSRNGAKLQGEGGGGTRCRKGAKCRKLFLHLLCNKHKTHKKCTQNAAEGVPGRAAADVPNITTIRSEEGQGAH